MLLILICSFYGLKNAHKAHWDETKKKLWPEEEERKLCNRKSWRPKWRCFIKQSTSRILRNIFTIVSDMKTFLLSFFYRRQRKIFSFSLRRQQCSGKFECRNCIQRKWDKRSRVVRWFICDIYGRVWCLSIIMLASGESANRIFPSHLKWKWKELFDYCRVECEDKTEIGLLSATETLALSITRFIKWTKGSECFPIVEYTKKNDLWQSAGGRVDQHCLHVNRFGFSLKHSRNLPLAKSAAMTNQRR